MGCSGSIDNTGLWGGSESWKNQVGGGAQKHMLVPATAGVCPTVQIIRHCTEISPPPLPFINQITAKMMKWVTKERVNVPARVGIKGWGKECRVIVDCVSLRKPNPLLIWAF